MGESPIVKVFNAPMDFGKAVKELLSNRKIRREEWPKDGTYLVIDNEKLMIYRPDDERLHPLIVSTGDLTGDDWVVC